VNQQLPPLPDSVKALSAEQSERLERLHSNLPKSLSQCVTCAGRKEFQWFEDYGFRDDPKIVTFDCPCSDQFVLFKFLLNAGIGKAYQRYALGDCADADPAAIAAVNEYLDSSEYYITQGRGLIFHGTHGTGKTLLTTILLKQLLAKGVDGYFTTFVGLLDNFAAGWKDDKEKHWFDKRIRNAPLLVVDDIGKENPNMNRMASSSLDGVFRSRTQNGLPTIVTTNLTPKEFEHTYSTSAMELLTETSLFYSFKGQSYRKTVQERNDTEAKLRLSRPITIS
jgi:DNA replication protein DnaC